MYTFNKKCLFSFLKMYIIMHLNITWKFMNKFVIAAFNSSTGVRADPSLTPSQAGVARGLGDSESATADQSTGARHPRRSG